MSTSSDPQTWVFPPLGAPDPPSGVAAAFGPVAQGDKILMEWTPSAETPNVNLICSNDNQVYSISDSDQSPLLYTFNQQLGNKSESGLYICHFFFANTQVGNTVTFQALNSASDDSVTWEQDSQLQSAFTGAATTVVQTASAAVKTSSIAGATTAGSQPETATSSASTPSPTASDSGLSTGAAAGIGVVAAAVFFALLFVGFLLWRRARGRRQQAPMPSQFGTDPSKMPPPMAQSHAYPAAPGPNNRPMYAELNSQQGIHELGQGR